MKTWLGVLAEDGPRLVFAHARSGLVRIVVGLVVVSSLLQLVHRAQSVLWNVVAVCGGAVIALLVRAWRRAPEAISLDPSSIIAQIDLDRRELLDGKGELLAPLDQVTFQICRPLFAQGPQLEARFGEHKLVVLHGSDFSGAVSRAKHALHAFGVPVAGLPPAGAPPPGRS